MTTPEKRTEYLMRAFGMKGGTIHQLSKITDCSVEDILYKEYPKGPEKDYLDGHFWYTNSKKYQEEHLIPLKKSNINFWLGVIRRTEIAEINCK